MTDHFEKISKNPPNWQTADELIAADFRDPNSFEKMTITPQAYQTRIMWKVSFLLGPINLVEWQ